MWCAFAPAVIQWDVPGLKGMERETGFEPATSTLARLHSTRFTFDNFVVGSCNQFAHAAARGGDL
jgi:chromosomal replication initiation ATPase DnaA